MGEMMSQGGCEELDSYETPKYLDSHETKMLEKHDRDGSMQEQTMPLKVEDRMESNRNIHALSRQIFGSTGSFVIPTCNGMILGFSAILFPQLTEDDSPIKLTIDEASWIASMAPLQMASGCLLGGWAMEKFGRKPVNIAASGLLMLGWACIVFATSMKHILAGRFISGLSIGFIGPSCTCYLGEITDPKFRGIFLSGITLGVAAGIFLVHILGTYLHWTTVSLISTFIPIIAIITFSISPESYIWLLKKGRTFEAKQSFHWFRGYGAQAKEEIDSAMQHHESSLNNDRSFKDICRECCKSTFIKPFVILNIFFIFSQFCGNNAVSFYSVSIMKNTVPSLDKYTAMLIVDTVRLVMSIVACVFTKKCRIRPLAIISGIGTALSLILLAIFSFLSEQTLSNKIYSTFAIIGLISFIIFLSIGFAPLPWLLCGELLPPKSKGIGSGISTCINFISMFVVVKTNPDLFHYCGVAGTYAIYGVLTILGTVTLFFVLPETKNKTLQDIQNIFMGKSKGVNTRFHS